MLFMHRFQSLKLNVFSACEVWPTKAALGSSSPIKKGKDKATIFYVDNSCSNNR